MKKAIVSEEVNTIIAAAEVAATAEPAHIDEVKAELTGRGKLDALLDAFVQLKNNKEAKADEVAKAENDLKEELKLFNAGKRREAYTNLVDLKDMFTKKSFKGVLKVKQEDGEDGFSAELQESYELFTIAKVKSYKHLKVADKGWVDKVNRLVDVLNAAFAAETDVGQLSDEFKKLFSGDKVETVSTNQLTSELQLAFDCIIFDVGTRDDGKNSYQAKKADARLLKAGAFDFKDKTGRFMPVTAKRVINLLTLLLCRTVGGNPIEVVTK